MPTHHINVRIDSQYEDEVIISWLSNALNTADGTQISFTIHLGAFCEPHKMLLVTCALKQLESIGKLHTVKFSLSDESKDYASRMNFFSHLNYKYTENFTRRQGHDNFLEITNFDKENDFKIVTSLSAILRKNTNISDDLLKVMDFCLGEMVDNVQLHANSDTGGWVVAQYYPNSSKIKIMICDAGIGIHKSLTSVEKYSNFRSEESLINCIERGVTDGKGKGMGLFYTSKFVRLNRGSMKVISGDKRLLFSRYNFFKKAIRDNDVWQGTAIYLEINTNILIDLDDFTEGDKGFFARYDDKYENEERSNLW